MEMVDWWTVRGDLWGVRNLDFKVELRRDDDLMTKDLDSYSPADQAALEKGDWSFVTITVIPVGYDLVDHTYVRQTLDDVEWGELTDKPVDRDDLMDSVKEMAGQAVIELLRAGITVETVEGSDFAPEKLAAPF